MIESGSVYSQITEAIRPKIAQLNKAFSIESPHKKIVASCATETAKLMKNNPELVPDAMQNYDSLIMEFDLLVMRKSPLLALFPHSQHLEEVLKNNTTGWKLLPTLSDLQRNPKWKKIMENGIKDAMAHIEVGNNLDLQNTETDNPLGERLKDKSIVLPARTDLDSATRLAAIEGHVVERIYLAWLTEKGYTGSKDEFISVFDEMAQYLRLKGEKSPLEEPYLKLGWINEEKFAKLQQKYELKSDTLPGAVSVILSPRDHKGEVFNESRCINLYEDPNPLMTHLLARRIGSISEQLSMQLGVDPKRAFSTILDTGEGIITVSFGEWSREGNGQMRRNCKIRTRGKDVVGSIDHITLYATESVGGSYDYSMEKYGFSLSFGHVQMQSHDEWMRTFTDEVHKDEFTNRPTTPRMLDSILSQIDITDKPIDFFKMKYPDQTIRGLAESILHGQDILVDEKKDLVHVPVKRRLSEGLPPDENVFKEMSISKLIKEERKKHDPGESYDVCDKVYDEIYKYDTQPIMTTG